MASIERSLRSVPKWVMLTLAVGLSAQITWHYLRSSPTVTIKFLKSPPKIEHLRLLSFGESIASAKILMLWLQSFNMQNGQFVSYRELDYAVLIQWLNHILQLDPKSQYPLLAASHLYSIVPDLLKQRQILEFVYEQFFIDPAHRWYPLAQAALLAQHRLKDLPLALKYTQALTDHAPPDAPHWVREMQIFVLDAMGEFKRAESIANDILSSGHITSADERIFLKEILENLQKKSNGFTH